MLQDIGTSIFFKKEHAENKLKYKCVTETVGKLMRKKNYWKYKATEEKRKRRRKSEHDKIRKS